MITIIIFIYFFPHSHSFDTSPQAKGICFKFIFCSMTEVAPHVNLTASSILYQRLELIALLNNSWCSLYRPYHMLNPSACLHFLSNKSILCPIEFKFLKNKVKLLHLVYNNQVTLRHLYWFQILAGQQFQRR